MRKQCKECFKEHDTERMVQFGDDWVCQDCKLTYVQKLEEGLIGECGPNECPYCAQPRSMTMGEYFRAGPMGEYLCPSCRKFSKIEVPRWIVRFKFLVFLLTLGLFWVGLSLLTRNVESVFLQAAIFILGIIIFVPTVLFLQLTLNKFVFIRYTRLVTLDDVMGKILKTESESDNDESGEGD